MNRIAAMTLGFFLIGLLLASPAQAQRRVPIVAKPAPQLQLQVDAYAGEPFGVARLTLDVPDEMLPEPLGAEGLRLEDKDGRVFFPVIHVPAFAAMAKEVLDSTPVLTRGPVRQEIRGILGDLLSQPAPKNIYFLFRGTAPLTLKVIGRSPMSTTVAVRSDAAGHRRLLAEWWDLYTAPPKLFETKPDYPPLVENYLKATLARRLNLKLPKLEQTDSPRELLVKELGLLSGVESIRMALEQNRLLGLHNLGLPADQPLPEVAEAAPLELPPLEQEPQVEQIAMRVPAEFFYVRFGSFSNFLWLQDTLALWGGDMQNLMALRGLDYSINKNIESQLVLQQGPMARLLGDAVIGDVAIVGTDMFFREGAAYGFLFQAKNNLALGADIARQRAERLAAGGASEEKLTIAGKAVSYLKSPDGRVRSYYVVSGDYHFVCTSRKLVERFLDTASGEGSLGASPDFRHARSLMPLSRGDTIFVYFSDAFFRNLTSPSYRIEMVRRLEAAADIELVQLAVLDAAAEGKRGGSIDALVAAASLPPDFGPRPDGSRAVLAKGEVYDSLRGRRGAFIPVPDLPGEQVTRAEATDYAKFAESLRSHWGRIDPMMIALKRHAVEKGREQVVVDARLSPFAAEHFEFLSKYAGAPSKQQIAPVPGDLLRFEFVAPKQDIFGGVRDIGPPQNLAANRILPFGRIRDWLIGYVGTTGELGLLSFLENPLLLPPDPRTGSQREAIIARQKTSQFHVFSFQQEVLAAVVPQLRFEEAARPAQVRLGIEDLSRAKAANFLTSFAYTRTLETSLGNLRLMHALAEQLHVPQKDCKEAAEFLLGAKLICPLGGEYVLRQPQGGPAEWTSTAIRGPIKRGVLSAVVPDGFEAPPLNWFRGLKLDATMTDKFLDAHAEVLMQLPKPQPPKKK